MAGKGTYGAYQRLQPVGAELSENIRHAERMGFHYRAEEARKKGNRTRRLELLAKEMGQDMSELKFDESGIKSVDAPLYQYFSRTKGEIADLYKKIEQDPDDYESRILLEKKMNSAKTLAGFTQRYADWQTNYKKALAEGKASAYLNKGLPEKINEKLLNGQYKVFNDKNGELQLFVDTDGDGENDQDFAAINVHDFLAGNPLYNIKERTNMDDVVSSLSDNYGTADVKTENGDWTKRVKGFDPENIGALQSDINRLMGESVESMTDKAKSVLADDLGIDPKTIDTEEKFNDFKNKIANSVKSRIDRVYEETYDQSAANSRANTELRRQELEYRKQQDALEGKSKDTKGEPGDINVVTKEGGAYKDESGAVNFTIRNGVKLGDKTVLGFSVKDGEVALRGNRPGTFEDGNFDGTDVPMTITDDTEIADYIVKIPNPETGEKFKNLKEFNQYAKKLETLYDSKNRGLGDPSKLPDIEL